MDSETKEPQNSETKTYYYRIHTVFTPGWGEGGWDDCPRLSGLVSESWVLGLQINGFFWFLNQTITSKMHLLKIFNILNLILLLFAWAPPYQPYHKPNEKSWTKHLPSHIQIRKLTWKSTFESNNWFLTSQHQPCSTAWRGLHTAMRTVTDSKTYEGQLTNSAPHILQPFVDSFGTPKGCHSKLW